VGEAMKIGRGDVRMMETLEVAMFEWIGFVEGVGLDCRHFFYY
jgi:hypothetical protein